jgi:hypothetical protein
VIRLHGEGRDVSASTDAQGVARFDGLVPGPLSLGVRTETSTESEPLHAVATSGSATEVRAILVPGGHVALKLERSDGVALASATHYPIEIRDASGAPWEWADAQDRPDGFVVFGPLRPGTFRVRARFGAKIAEASVSVAIGEVRELVLREPD